MGSKKNHGVKKEDYFVHNGTSPRNKIMRIMLNLLEITEDDFDVQSCAKIIEKTVKNGHLSLATSNLKLF